MKRLLDLESYRGRRLHLFGGTMDPIHAGHIFITRAAREEMGWEELALMVAGSPPHKRDRRITPPEDRLMMARLAVEEEPGLTVCDWEARRESFAYTAQTLRLLKQEFGIAGIDFMIGADSLMMLERWYQPEVILREAAIVAAGRPDQAGSEALARQAEYLRHKYGAQITLLSVEGPEVSATGLRQQLTRGEDPGEAIPRAVWDYIQRHKLYKEGETHE